MVTPRISAGGDLQEGRGQADNEPRETKVDVGSSPAGPCASEVRIRPVQSVQFEEEVLAANSCKEYPDEFLEHMRKHKVSRDSPARGMWWREWQEEAERVERDAAAEVEPYGEDMIDDDGAVYFDGSGGSECESRQVAGEAESRDDPEASS